MRHPIKTVLAGVNKEYSGQRNSLLVPDKRYSEDMMRPQGVNYTSHLPAQPARSELEQMEWVAARERRRLAAALRRQQEIGDLPGVHDVADDPAFEALRTQVRESGCDCLRKFANGYTREGGLALQQNPDEFAAFCLFLQRRGPFATYVEIGSASGGTTLFLSRHVGFDRVMSIDDGQSLRAVEQAVNLAQIPNLTQFRGDSHSPEARTFLADALPGRDLELAFIDGDHSDEGVWADLQLILDFARPGSLIVFHDTRSCEGVETAWLNAAQQGLLVPLAEFVGDSRPLGIGVAEVPPAS